MKKVLYLFMLISLLACKKTEKSETLEEHIVGKWVLYNVAGNRGVSGLVGFEFKDGGKLHLYQSTTFGSGQIDTYSWKEKDENTIEITYQSSSDSQANPVFFSNISQGHSVTITLSDWKDDGDIIHISILGNSYILSK